MNVHHADREIEYFGLRRFCMDLRPGEPHTVGDTSWKAWPSTCWKSWFTKYPDRIWELRVLENAGNGAVIQCADMPPKAQEESR